jgi:hypothetical protein
MTNVKIKTRRCSDKRSVRDEEGTMLWCPEKGNAGVAARVSLAGRAIVADWQFPNLARAFIHTSEIGNLLGAPESLQDCESQVCRAVCEIFGCPWRMWLQIF